MNYQYPAGVPLTRQNSASPFQQAGLIPSMNLPMGYPGMMAQPPMMVHVGQPMMHPMMAQPPMMVQVGQPMMQPVVQPIVAQQFAVGVQQTIIQTPDRDPGDPRPDPSGGSAAARDTNRSPPPGPAPDPSPPSRGSDGSLIVKSGVANPGEYLTKQVMPKDKNSIGQALFDENIGIQKYDQVSVVEQVNQNQGLAEDMKGFAVDADFRLYYSVFDATAKRVLLKSQRLQKSGNPVLPNDDLMCHPHSHAKSCVPTCFCCQWPTGDLPTFSAILKGEQLLIQYESDIVKIVEAKIAKNGDPKRVFTTLERMALPHSACCFPLFFLPCLFCCGKYKSFVLEFQLLESNAVAASSPLNRSGSNIAQGTRASLGASNRASGVSSRSTAVEGES